MLERSSLGSFGPGSPLTFQPLLMVTWHHLWRSLTPRSRETAARAFWERTKDPELLASAFHALSKQGGFREATIAGMGIEKRTKRLARTFSLPAFMIRDIIQDLYLGPWVETLVVLLDGLGIPHERGILQGEVEGIDPPTLERSTTALRNAYQAFSEVRIVPLVQALHLLHPRLYSRLPLALEALESAAVEGETAAVESGSPETSGIRQEEEEEESQTPEATQPGRFTTLDRSLIQAVVASVSGIEGAFDEDQIEDLVEEVLHLNPGRHQSYFHRGFLDVLSSREAKMDFPESNQSRRTWYLAGAITAFARLGEWQAMGGLLDRFREDCENLFGKARDAVPYALPYFLTGMWKTDREAEIPAVVHPAALGTLEPRFLTRELSRATGLLLDQEPERAEPLLILLRKAMQWREKNELEVDPGFEVVLQRRCAHALRMRGDLHGARRLLLPLVERGGARERAQVQADLGLLESGYRSLSRIRFPDHRQELGDLAAELERGRVQFATAVKIADVDSGHGHYCLAMLALARGDSKEALAHAERAEASFAAKPDTYERGNLLARARLVLGWALAMELERTRTGKVADCLAYAIRRLGPEGLYLVEEAVGALSVSSVPVTIQLVENLREVLRGIGHPDEGILNAAVQSDEVLQQSEDMRSLLLERAAAVGRSRAERFEDAQRVLVIAERLDDPELANDALDIMQGIALRNPMSAETRVFLELLEKEDMVSTGWEGPDILEARAGLHRVRGDCAEAANLLERMAHQILSQGHAEAAEEVVDLLEEIRSLGVEGLPSPALVSRVSHSSTLSAEPAASPLLASPLRGRILFCGGNETQTRYDQELEERMARDFPGIQIDFQHLGWGANWGRQRVSLRNALERADACVLLRFMRTMCGRYLRRTAGELGKPWVACTGHGRSSLERALRRAAAVIQRLDRQRVEAD